VKKQPVGSPLHILTLLYSNTGCHVNELVRKTGSKDKPRVLNSIKELEKSNLVETKKLNHKTQKKIKILTPLGHEFASLIESIHRYESSYNKFKGTIKEKYELSLAGDSNAFKSKLLYKGWDKQDINYYDIWYKTIQRFDTLVAFHFILALVAKYASILIKFEINKSAQSILIKIIMETLNRQLSNRFLIEKKTSSMNRLKEPEDFFDELLRELSRDVENFVGVYTLAFGTQYTHTKPIKYGRQEAYKLTESVFLLLRSHTEFESVFNKAREECEFNL
jgi:DNA-binding HxlR family transcriptional regulator